MATGPSQTFSGFRELEKVRRRSTDDRRLVPAVRRRESTAMAERDTMTVEQVVRKVMS